MKKIFPFLLVIIIPLCFILQITGKDLFPASPIKPSGKVIQQSSKDWAVLFYKKNHLMNNVFNKQLAQKPYKQTIFLEDLNGREIPGWHWDWPECPAICTYPEIVYGSSPWDTIFPKVPDLPQRIGGKRIIADFDINLKAQGIYRLTFLIWVVSSLPPSNKKITHLILITIDNHNMTPDAAPFGQVTVGGHTFDVFSSHYIHQTGPDYPICYVNFVAKKSFFKGPLDLTAFTDYLSEKKVLTKNLYITDVELGNHVVSGSGLVELKEFSISIR